MEDLILFPAIDLKDGACVRLHKGDMDTATIFNDTPSNQAKSFEDQGFSWLHVVDLNGAFEGHSVNKTAIESIRKAMNIPIQLGGGIRNMQHIEDWIALGIDRIILGTVAVTDPSFVRAACKAFPGKIAVGMDAREGKVATQGWAEQTDIKATELAKHFEDCGVSAIIYTDINRDGALKGVNIEQTADFAGSTKIPVIASGGLRDYDDIHRLKQYQTKGIIGVISGKALYTNAIEAEPALKICKGNQ